MNLAYYHILQLSKIANKIALLNLLEGVPFSKPGQGCELLLTNLTSQHEICAKEVEQRGSPANQFQSCFE